MTWEGLLRWVNVRKGAGPDSIPCRDLKTCTELAQGGHQYFQTIHDTVQALHASRDSWSIWCPSHPLQLSWKITVIQWPSLVMKCFERHIQGFLCFSLPSMLGLLQFTYWSNRSTDDAIFHVLHTALSQPNMGRGELLFIVQAVR